MAAARTRPIARLAGSALPASSSHSTNTPTATAMPPTSEAVERLSAAMGRSSADLRGQGIVGAGAHLAEAGLHMPFAIAVEDMAEETAIEIARAEQPIGDGISEVHVPRHHDRRVVVGDVMAADRVDERDMPNDAVIADMAAIVKELVIEIDAGGGADEKPRGIGRPKEVQDHGARRRHDEEGHESVGRKEGDAEVALRVEERLEMGEELVMGERMAPIDAHEALDRTMHDEAVDPPLEDVAAEKTRRHDEPFEHARAMDIPRRIPDHREADGIDERDMKPAVIPGRDARPVIRAERRLPLAHHRAIPPGRRCISNISVAARSAKRHLSR